MSKYFQLLVVVAVFSLTSFQLEARSSDESMMMLKEAMMDSNSDYNKHKKKANHEEFDRVEKWGRRSAGTIMIDGKEATASDLEEYKIVQENKVREDREVSAVTQEDQ